jgi:S1-C subfamily serine protease
LSVDHGIEKEEGIQILVPDKGLDSARVVGRDGGTDLALLQLDHEYGDWPSFQHENARVGLPVIMVGRPEPENPQASWGIVTSVGSGVRTARGSILDQYIATDATAYPGFSGGPLLTISGGVLGINTSGLVGGLSIAIPIQIALNVVDQLEKFGRVKRGYLGVRSQRVEIPEQIVRSGEINQKSGLLIVGLETDGPALIAGLLVGDILVSFEGEPLNDQDDLMSHLSRDVAGKEISLRVIRGGKITNIPIKIGEKGT